MCSPPLSLLLASMTINHILTHFFSARFHSNPFFFNVRLRLCTSVIHSIEEVIFIDLDSGELIPHPRDYQLLPSHSS